MQKEQSLGLIRTILSKGQEMLDRLNYLPLCARFYHPNWSAEWAKGSGEQWTVH